MSGPCMVCGALCTAATCSPKCARELMEIRRAQRAQARSGAADYRARLAAQAIPFPRISDALRDMRESVARLLAEGRRAANRLETCAR